MMPFAADLGVGLETASPDRVVAVLPWAPRLCTTSGVLHGGALMALADSAGALVAFLGLPDGATTRDDYVDHADVQAGHRWDGAGRRGAAAPGPHNGHRPDEHARRGLQACRADNPDPGDTLGSLVMSGQASSDR
jgi:hypothetical protein